MSSIDVADLPLVRGFDDAVDADIGSSEQDPADGTDLSRLNCTLNLVPDGICTERRLAAEDRVRMSPPNCAGAACVGYSVSRLLRVGSYAEDNPNPRASHHFFDPTREGSDRGLDNRSEWLLGLDVMLAEFVTLVRGGEPLRVLSGIATALGFSLADLNQGNFDLDGQPATERATGGETASADHPENVFSARDAERYLYRSLTAPTELERKHHLALHVLAVGHVAHLLEDMGNPAHTRNDFLIDHLHYIHRDLEDQGSRSGSIEFVKGLRAGDISSSRAASYANDPNVAQLAAAKGQPLPLSYGSTIPLQDTSEFDLLDFWQPLLRDDLSVPDGFGLAEISNSEFFSGGSVGDEHEAPGRPGCPRDPDARFEAAPVGGVVRALLPEREPMPADGESDRPVDPETPVGIFYSSPLVPHLARCRYHALAQKEAQIRGTQFAWAATAIDESVQRDYLEILLPLTVDYTAKFLRHYFQARIELVPQHDGQFKLKNLMRLPFEAHEGAVEVVFDTKDGGRRALPVDCGDNTISLAANLGADSDPESGATCTLPGTGASSDPNSPKDPGEFWIVVRGKLGSRGTADEPPTNWKEGDYVTVFARSRNEVLYSAAAPPFGAVGMAPEEWDAIERHDLCRSPVNLDGVDPNAPATTYENATAHLRTSNLDDFRRAAVSPTRKRIALVSDVGVLPANQHYEVSTSPDDPNVLIPLAPLGVVARAGVLEFTEANPEGALRFVGGDEDDRGQLPVWLLGTERFFARRTGGANPADELALYDAETGADLAHPVLDNFPVTGSVVGLIQAAGQSPARGCGLSGDDLLAAKQDADLGMLLAATVLCLQPVPAEGGGETFGAVANTGQLVLLDAQGQALEAVMIDADDAREPQSRPCSGGCDFDGFTAPRIEHASFSPGATKVALVVGKRNAFSEVGRRIYVYDYLTKAITRIPEPEQCVQGWLTWLPDGERIAYLSSGAAPCAETTEGAQLHVIGADGAPASRKIVTNFAYGPRRANPTWWSPLRIPFTAPASGP